MGLVPWASGFHTLSYIDNFVGGKTMGKTNRHGEQTNGGKREKGEDAPRHTRHLELGNPQRVSPEEKTLRGLLTTNIAEAIALCAMDSKYAEAIARLATEQSRIGERARTAQLFPAMEDELLEYLKSGSMDNVETLDKLLARFAAETVEAAALHQALNRCARSTLPVVRERAEQLRAALSIPNRMEEAKRMLAGDDGFAAIIATARFAGRDPMNVVAVEKIATMETGELQRRARVALLYPAALSHLADQLDEAARDLGSAMDLISFIKVVGESLEGLAVRIAFKALCNNPDNRYARYLRGIMNNGLLWEFFSKFHGSGAESVAEWMKQLGAQERKQVETAMTAYMKDGAENAISKAAFSVYAILHPPVKERVAASVAAAPGPEPKKEQSRAGVPVVVAERNEAWALATILNAY